MLMKNSEETRKRILHAATEEFASFGIAGARIDRIAKASRSNKSLIYVHYGSKEGLFTEVLAQHLKDVYKTVHFTAGDLPGYAAGLFDFAMDHPELMRLVMWCGLEQRKEWPLDEWSSFDAQLKGIAEAQSGGKVASDYSPRFLLTLILSIATAWTAANPFGFSIEPDAVEHRDVLREAILLAVERICKARQEQSVGSH